MSLYSSLKQAQFLTVSMAVVAFVIPAASVQAGATYHNVPGIACGAFNNSQADRLERNHARLYNPPMSGRSTWVVCPVQRVQEDVAASVNRPLFRVTAFFATQATGGVSCLVREFDNNTVHQIGDGGVVGTTGITNVASMSIPLPGTLPGTTERSVTLANDDTSIQQYFTVTCLLPPGTGINEIDAFQR